MRRLNSQQYHVAFDQWQQILATAAIVFISWSFAPFSYAVGVSGTHFNAHMGMLFLYEFLIAYSLVLLLKHHFQAPLAWPLLGLSALCAIAGFITTPLVMLLLLLLPLFTVLLTWPTLQLQNELGLFTCGALLMLTVPVGVAYTSLHFISWEIVTYLLPVMTTTWCFWAPFFMPGSNRRALVMLIALLILLISLLSHPLRWPILAAGLISLGWWLFTMYKKTPEPSLLLTCLTQMLVIVFTYWS